MQKRKISHIYELNVWKEEHRLVLVIYKLIEKLPAKEKFVLSSQMLRAAISITSNIAEGFGRQSLKEKIQFYYIAKASLTELQNQLMICRDVGYLTSNRFNSIWEQTVVIHKMHNALISSLKKKYPICHILSTIY